MTTDMQNGTPRRGPASTSISTREAKDSSRRRLDASPKDEPLTVHVSSPASGGDWPHVIFSGDGDYEHIASVLRKIPSGVRNYNGKTKIWSAQPDHLAPRIDEIKALGYPVKDNRPKAPELADAYLIAMGDDDQIDDALDALDGLIGPCFFAELLAARDRRRGLAQ